MSRIATWNLERPVASRGVKITRQLAQIERVNADLWLLTETRSSIQLPGYACVSSTPADWYHKPGESCAAIHTRWRIVRPVATFNEHFAIAALLDAPWGPTLAYATIITYAGDRGPDRSAKRWQLHRKYVEEHRADWLRLRAEFPDSNFIVGGDFNQSLDGSGWSNDPVATPRLQQALKDTALECVTGRDFRKSKELEKRASVVHICLDRTFAKRASVGVEVWEGRGKDGPMSDHNGVCVTVDHG